MSGVEVTGKQILEMLVWFMVENNIPDTKAEFFVNGNFYKMKVELEKVQED